MPVAATGRRRFQFSLRSILIVTALTAILLVPVAWVSRERQQMIQARQEVLRARQEAIHAVVLAEARPTARQSRTQRRPGLIRGNPQRLARMPR